jgi:hypothetical protein
VTDHNPPDGFPSGEQSLPQPPLQPREPWVSSTELRFATWVIAILVALGALLGVGWARWSRTPTRGLIYTGHAIIPDQTEGFISSDARFVVLTGVTGLLAGLLAWRWRAPRGPVAVAALAVGGVLGALVTSLVGAVLGGGRATGAINTVVPRLPLRVHALGCLFIEAALATALYLLFTLFVTPDDLDRRTDDRDRPDESLVRAGLEA